VQDDDVPDLVENFEETSKQDEKKEDQGAHVETFESFLSYLFFSDLVYYSTFSFFFFLFLFPF